MNLINHGRIAKKIKGYLDKETGVENILTIKEQERELANLNIIFGNSFETPGYLENLKTVTTDNRTIYYYDVVSVDKQKRANYIAVSENDRPLLLVSRSKNGNDDAKYAEETFTVYDKETKKIDSRIKSNLMIIGDSAVLEVNLLDKKFDEYYRKEYKFYYAINQIVSYQIGNDKFFNYEDSRMDLAIKTIDYVSNKIETEIDANLGINLDYVKEYHIKRKAK